MYSRNVLQNVSNSEEGRVTPGTTSNSSLAILDIGFACFLSHDLKAGLTLTDIQLFDINKSTHHDGLASHQ